MSAIAIDRGGVGESVLYKTGLFLRTAAEMLGVVPVAKTVRTAAGVKTTKLYWLEEAEILVELKKGNQCQYGEWLIIAGDATLVVRSEKAGKGFVTFDSLSISSVESAISFIESHESQASAMGAHSVKPLKGMALASSITPQIFTAGGANHG